MDDSCSIEKRKYLEAMHIGLDKLREEHPSPDDLDEFYRLYKRFIGNKDAEIPWSDIKPPKDELVDYDDLDECLNASELFSKLVVLKLNGGLGTTMGCEGPKSSIKVRDDMNFIDVVAKQLKTLNEVYDCQVPLVLMNSFNTDERTHEMILRHPGIRTFSQSMFPRIAVRSLMLTSEDVYYPPGHGDLFYSLTKSGMLDALIAEGKEYVFVSNIDNLAATADLKILSYVANQKLDFCMEVTKRTRADIKGGTLVSLDNKLTLLEIGQVPDDKKGEFTDIRRFRIFNTNSVWIRLQAIKELMEQSLELDIIPNRKTINGESVIQLETAIGAAVKYFENNCGVIVPRSRFLPVKTCSDLLLLESNLFSEQNGLLSISSARISQDLPVIKLCGPNFANVFAYQNAFAGIPDILDLVLLIVSGNVTFGKNVVLKGIVVICAAEGCRIDIPDGAVLEDKTLVGNLPMTDL